MKRAKKNHSDKEILKLRHTLQMLKKLMLVFLRLMIENRLKKLLR